jgi:hypothetical protein
VKRLFAAAAALLGIAWFRRKKPVQAADPAEELREKLAQARESQDREEFEAGEKPVDEAVEERRRAVHEQARQTIDEFSGLETPPAKPPASGQ